MSKPKKIETNEQEIELLRKVKAEIDGIIYDHLNFDGIESAFPSAEKVSIQLDNIIKFIARVESDFASKE